MDKIEIFRYLQEICSPPLLHKNIKSSNILLDTDLNPRLSDYGLASFHQVFCCFSLLIIVYLFPSLYCLYGILIWCFNIPRNASCIFCFWLSLVNIGLSYLLARTVCFIVFISPQILIASLAASFSLFLGMWNRVSQIWRLHLCTMWMIWRKLLQLTRRTGFRKLRKPGELY